MSFKPTIMKFGGTSVEDAFAFERVAHIVGAHKPVRPVVIVSAMSRVTDALMASIEMVVGGENERAWVTLDEHFERHLSVARSLLIKEDVTAFESLLEEAREEIIDLLQTVSTQPGSRSALRDYILSYGERISSTLLAAVLRASGLPARYVDARHCIITDSEHGCATPLPEETARCTRQELVPLIEDAKIPVLGGFIGACASGATTTLGRGCSDYTAALVGEALTAREIQIWSDVAGVLTADPRLVEAARTVSHLSYKEATELAYFGAKVLHPKTIRPAFRGRIPLRICNSRAPEDAGTLVCAETEVSPRIVKAIAHKTGVTTLQVTSRHVLGAHRFLRAIFEIFDQHCTIVDLVTSSEVSVSLSLDDVRALPFIVSELRQLGDVEVEQCRAIICVIGEGTRGRSGVAARVFSALKDIRVSFISHGASSINLTFVVAERDVRGAVARLHAEFFENQRQSSKAVAVALQGADR